MKGFWIVTTYYNPCGYRTRRENYQRFRRGLGGAPLLTVELARPGCFELSDEDATRLLRIESDDVLWQKERLINVALDHLPPECEKIAWVDCDVLFQSDSWIEEASSALETSALVQCFTRMCYLPQDPEFGAPLAEQTYFTRPSLAATTLKTGPPVGKTSLAEAVRHGLSFGGAAGVAWSMRRDALAGVGLYDAMIVGGGDGALAIAALGEFDQAQRLFRLSTAHREHYLEWAAKFFSLVGGRLGVVAGDILHLWHGDLQDRKYHLRHRILRRFSFDPNADIAVGESGCWRWSSEKPELHEAVAAFFARRREDGGPRDSGPA